MLINNINFTIGADPEVFVSDGGQGFKPAVGMVQGTKEEPFIVNKGAVQVDGMALEFNIDPANDKQEFISNIHEVTNILQGMIGDEKLSEECSVFFTDDLVKNVPFKNLELGCSPDYNGWTGWENEIDAGIKNMRTAGGHIHIGGFGVDDEWCPAHFDTCRRMSRLMDEFVGVYSLLWDKDDQRRALYGKAGAFRAKKYGMEYRTLSNKWIFSDKIMSFVYDQTLMAIEKMFDTGWESPEFIREIIDTSDRNHDFFKNNETVERLMA